MVNQKAMFKDKIKSKEFKNHIEIHNLNLTKQSDHILKNINLKISSDGITFILGPNGSGKTLIVRCMHGLEKISGSIKFGTIELTKNIKKKQSFVFQNPIILRRSVLDNLLYFARHRNVKDYKEKCINLLKFVELDKFIKNPAITLSGGEKQRLSLARALTTDPDYLFLDESTAHLDPVSLSIIESSLKKINKSGTKIIFISHDIEQTKRLADDIIFMHKGKVREHSNIEQFFLKPKSRYSKIYLQGRIIS